MATTLTACPFCGFDLPLDVDACPRCNLPLAEPVGAEVNPPLPEYCRGRLVVVTTVNNQAEADMIDGLLRVEGIPCIVKRNQRAEKSEWPIAELYDIVVPESGVFAARELLQLPDVPAYTGPSARGMVIGLAIGMLLLVAVVAVAYLLTAS